MNGAKLAAWLIPFFTTLVSSCATDRQPDYFVVKVDSLSAPDSLQLGDDLAVGLWGMIGGDGRYAFSHFEAEATDSSLDLTAWAKFTPADYSTLPIVDIDGRQYHTVAGSPGTFRVRIHQPDGNVLRDSVSVVQPDSYPPAAPRVAWIESITAPDTVQVGQTFTPSFHAIMGEHLSYRLHQIDTVRTNSFLAVRIWSVDVSNGGYVLWMILERDYSFTASAQKPGEFSIIACQPDGSTTVKSVTVIP